MDVFQSIGDTLAQRRPGASANASTNNAGAQAHPYLQTQHPAAAATASTLDTVLINRFAPPYGGASSSSSPSSSSSASALDVSTGFHETFKVTLAEADSYLAIFEARVKLEEEYARGLKTLADKQRDVDVKLDSRLAQVLNLEPGGSEWPGARLAWKELRENDLRELDTRQHYIETLRQGVIAPLTVYRDAQERIRKRVKEDLKTSIGRYDEMRHTTLPRVRKMYEKRCDEVEQIRQQQQAIEDQRALLSPPAMAMSREASGAGNGSSQPEEEDEASSDVDHYGEAYRSDDASSYGTSPSAPRRSKSSRRSFKGTQQQRQSQQQQQLQHKRNSSRSSFRSDDEAGSPRGIHLSPKMGGDQNLYATSPNKGPGHFLDALRSRENWEAARKEAPKKINALLSRMGGGGGGGGTATTGGMTNDRSLSSGTGNSETGAGALGIFTGGVGGSSELGSGMLGNSSGSMRSTQNLAIKLVKAKREAEDADKAYRKTVFDLETLRLRRNKTLQAALASVVECRRELHLTCQAVWMQAERSGLLLASSHASLRTQAEEVVKDSLVGLDDELVRVEKRLPMLSEAHDSRVAYVNYQFGECKDLIFGVSLIDYAFTRAQHAAPTLGGPTRAQPPLIVRKCIQFIEERALDHPGIYRISAKHTAIQNLAHAVEKDEERFKFRPEVDEPATVAGVLKQYLRQLPEPVMPIPWEERIRHTQERDEQIQTGFANLKSRIRRLPSINQETLKLIVGHLAKVAAHADKNKMNANNLSIVFGPLLLSQADHETTSIAAAMEEDRVTEDLILYADDVFDLSHAGAPVLPNIVAPTASLDLEGVEEETIMNHSKVEGSGEHLEGLPKPIIVEPIQQQQPIPIAPAVNGVAVQTTTTTTTSSAMSDDAAQFYKPPPPPTTTTIVSEGAPVASSADVPLVLSSSTDLKRSDAIGRGNTMSPGEELTTAVQTKTAAAAEEEEENEKENLQARETSTVVRNSPAAELPEGEVATASSA